MMNILMRYYCMPRRKLSRTIVGGLIILTIFTFFVKIKLMSSFLESTQDRNPISLLRRNSPFKFKKSNKVIVEEETTASSHDIQETISIVNKQIVPQVWRHPRSDKFYKCVKRAEKDRRKVNATNGYMVVRSNGGLNQMKAGISDMVAIAKLMNATLVLPTLDHKSFWTDPSEFKDIFNWKHFIKTLEDDIVIVDSLPPSYALLKKARRSPASWAKGAYYKGNILKILKARKVLEFTHSDSRLANNGVSHPIQRLRCRAMFEALKFHEDIEALGNKLVSRLTENGGRYIALHLRYEKDMLAFTGCDHNLTTMEAKDLLKLRKNVKHWKEKNINGTERRLDGVCPMTPRETGLFLQALRFPSNTNIYIVAGRIYGQNGIEDLQKMFPNIYYHSNLATQDELKMFEGKHNQLAALDYIVALESNVFVYTHDGNMAKAVRGHRIFEGFRKTVSPHRGNLVRLIDKLDKGELQYEDFSENVKNMHRNRDGGPYLREVGETPKLEENFYANPLPGCICEKPWAR